MAVQITSGAADLFRSDQPLGDTTLSDPTPGGVVAGLIDGEFLTCLDAGAATTGWRRLANAGASQTLAIADGLCSMVFSQRGNMNAQATGKVTLVREGNYTIETDVYDTTTVGGGGSVIADYAVGSNLTAIALNDAGTDPHAGRMVLGSVVTAGTDPVVGIVEIAPTTLGGLMTVRVLSDQQIVG